MQMNSAKITVALFLVISPLFCFSETVDNGQEASSTNDSGNSNANICRLPDEDAESERKKRQIVFLNNLTSTSADVTNIQILSDYNTTTKQFNNSKIVNEDHTTEESIEDYLKRFSEEFQNCGHAEIYPECFDVLPNGSVYVPTYMKAFNSTDFVIGNDGELYVCSPSEDIIHSPKFDEVLRIMTQVGIGISILSLLLHMCMFFCISSLRNLPGYCLFSLCIALLVSYICFYMPMILENEDDCSDLGVAMYYFFLVSFFWMNVLSFDVWRSLRMATCKLRLTGDGSMWLRFSMYSLYAWGTPILLVIIVIVIDATGDVPEYYQLQFSVTTCWFEYKEALLMYFALPLFTLLGLNLLFFLSSFLMITRASMNTVENKAILWSRFRTFMRLAVIMGLTWIFGVLAVVTQVNALWYFFVIFNSSQGILIFFSFSINEKTKKVWEKKVTKRKISGLPTQCSSTHSHPTTSV